MIFVGDDWAEDHHDIHVMNIDGKRLATRRLPEGLAGIAAFHDVVAPAKSRKNYAGTSPLTVASGKKRAVLARHVWNRRLYDAIDQWAFCALSQSPGARAYYDSHRAAGNLHHQALRALGNRLVGILHGCLRHHSHYDEHTAWGHREAQQLSAA